MRKGRSKSKATAKAKPSAKGREQRQAEKRALAIWALLGNGGSGFGGAMKPEVEKAEREALVQAGLITVERRNRSFWLEVTDHGWRWAEDHLDHGLPDRTYAGAFVLRAWLARLAAFMKAEGIGLAEVLGPQTHPRGAISSGQSHTPDRIDYETLHGRIRKAYLDVTGGSFNQRALLSEIRARLSDVARVELDDALTKMHFEEGTTLMGLDNPREITPAVRAAELTFRGEPMHILWISK